ncbi:MAG: hypothetical protein AAGG01_02970, partial [Planctomycetota bacterium]
MKNASDQRSSNAGLALSLLTILPLSACAANAPGDYMEGTTRSSAIGSRDGSYAVATSPDELRRLVAEDLEAQSAERVYSGLEAFVGENISRQTATRAHLIWEVVRPTTMLQYGQGRSVMTGVKQLGDLLANEGEKEMQTAFETLRQGDFEAVERLRDEPMGVFHPSTAAMSREVRPYALLADGVLSYRDVAASQGATEAELDAALTKLSLAQSELAKIGETKGMFLADAAAAQALERAGQIDAAAEYWMRIADSDEFLAQPEVMRHLVAARIKTYGVRMKERLIVEVEEERRAELRARDAQYSAQVSKLSDKHRSFDAWARQGFQSAAKRMTDLSREDEGMRAQLAALASTAEERDAELGRAADALAVRLSVVDDRTNELSADAETAAERASDLESKLDTERIRVDREVAQMRGHLDQAVASLRTDQAGLAARAAKLEARATELGLASGANAEEIAALSTQAAQLRQQAARLQANADGSEAARSEIVSMVQRSDAELAQALQDLASYHAAVDELTATTSLEALAGLEAAVEPSLEP